MMSNRFKERMYLKMIMIYCSLDLATWTIKVFIFRPLILLIRCFELYFNLNYCFVLLQKDLAVQR